jgi:hypothetical protein
MTVANTLAYYDSLEKMNTLAYYENSSIAAVKSFIAFSRASFYHILFG